MDRVRTDGKQFAVGGDRFRFRGVTYGTFRPRESDGARFPELDGIKKDFALMRERGFSVVRTYTAPTDDLLDLAADWGLRVLAGAFFADWRYLVGASRRELARVAADARREVTEVARRLADNPAVLGLSLGNEIPADVLRWFGTSRIGRVLDGLAEVVRDVDPE